MESLKVDDLMSNASSVGTPLVETGYGLEKAPTARAPSVSTSRGSVTCSVYENEGCFALIMLEAGVDAVPSDRRDAFEVDRLGCWFV